MGVVHDLIINTVKKEMHIGGIVVRIFRDADVNLWQGKLYISKHG